ncbi:MAG: hypothetical protein H7Z40_23215 [Phycisphaerae bacterium]|nr:hypothetical protein [Gemmatimonadaceae bacterium]
MNTFFLTCAVVGAVILVAQLVLSAFGGDHGNASHGDMSPGDMPHEAVPHAQASEGLQLLSARALSAGVAFFGIGALAINALKGVPSLLAAAGGVVVGAVAMLGVALIMRSLLRLESDGSINIYGAVGAAATVYLPIPSGKSGAGKVTLALQGRTVEYQAVTAEGTILPTGMAVVIVDVHSSDTVEVAPLPLIDGVM